MTTREFFRLWRDVFSLSFSLLVTGVPGVAGIVYLPDPGYVYAYANFGAYFQSSPNLTGTAIASTATQVPGAAAVIYQTRVEEMNLQFEAEVLAIVDPGIPPEPSFANAILSLWFQLDVGQETLLDFTLSSQEMECADSGFVYFTVTAGPTSIDVTECAGSWRTGQFLISPGGVPLAIHLQAIAPDSGAGSFARGRYLFSLTPAAVPPPDPITLIPEPERLFFVAAGVSALGVLLRRRLDGALAGRHP